jgi:ribosomal protein S18 acetylase RimI-like enzyme
MEINNFKGKKITIRKLSSRGLKIVPQWVRYINGLIEEDIYLLVQKKYTLAGERDWLRGELKKIKARREVILVAETDKKIVGTAAISLLSGKQSHVGLFGISISKDYRRMGLGDFLINKIISLAKKEIKPAPKMIYLCVFAENQIARDLYKKTGFKEVARIPNHLMHKGQLMDEIIMQLYL